MSLNNKDRVAIENCLEQIYTHIVNSLPDNSNAQIREYMDVGEYGLALDDMACVALEGGAPVATGLRQLFGKAADLVAIKRGDGWGGVDDLLSRG